MATTTISTTPSPTSNTEAGPSQGHLGTSWEIAVAVIIIVLACIVIATVVWQIRRRRQRQKRLLLASAAEEGRGGSPIQSQMEHLPPDGIRSAVDAEVERASYSLTKPRPTASPYRPRKSSTSSSHTDHRPIQPQRYYWDP